RPSRGRSRQRRQHGRLGRADRTGRSGRDRRLSARMHLPERSGPTGFAAFVAVALVAAASLGLATSRPASAATIDVTNSAQLQAAVINANPGDTIVLSASTDPNGVYSTTSPLVIRGDLTLEGPQSGSGAIIVGTQITCPCPAEFGSPDTFDI